jgi:hypothetical protein
VEAEAPMRRALAIDEASYGPDHPNVAIRLNNLAQLLKATNRTSEAEDPMRRCVAIFLNFTRQTSHEHPHLRPAVKNYNQLLIALKLPPDQLLEKLATLGPEPLAILRQQSQNDPDPT